MSNILGTVVSVNLSTSVQKQDGTGVYPAWELVFRDADGKVGSVQKHVNTLKYTKGLKTSLESLSPGENFVLVMEKGKNGFNEVQSISKGDFPMAVAESKPLVGKVTGSNYETAVERATRQRLIVRQSSLSNAIEFYSVMKEKGTPTDVMALADVFTAFVFESKDEVSNG